jgi:lysyl-tRNA synthetase class 2
MISREFAKIRADLRTAVRAFFDTAGYLEVDTPALARELIPEAHIEVFRSDYVHPYEPGHALFLIPSPEVHLKPLLARGFGNLYFLGHCFRNAESRSPKHNPEFSMLEWYTVGHDYADSLHMTEELLHTLVGAGVLARPVERVTMAEAWERFAGLSGELFGEPDGMRRGAEKLQMRVDPGESEEDLFQRILIAHVEPALPTDHPVALLDYPALVPTLAARKQDAPHFTERWELYVGTTELANCYTEERDPRMLREFLEAESREKSQALVSHPSSNSLLRFSEAPACSGVALGFDRLLMLLLEQDDIQGVIFSD